MTALAETAAAALHALQGIASHAQSATTTWLGALGPAVSRRPDGTSLEQLRAAMVTANAGTAIDGSSKGNLSKAATSWEVLVRDGGLNVHDLSPFRQRDIYAAAQRVLSGDLTPALALLLLKSGEVRAQRDEQERRRPDPAPSDQPDRAPDQPDHDPLMVAVYEAALAGAQAAGVPVLDWVRAHAAQALVEC